MRAREYDPWGNPRVGVVSLRPPICVFQVSPVSLVICKVGTWLSVHSLCE